MIRLHYYPGNASFAPHVLLHEIGAPFETVLVDRAKDAHKSPEYLKLNPNGQIPVLEDGSMVMHETAAICLHLADAHPGAALVPPLGSPERAHYYQWMVWLSNMPQAMMKHYFYADRMVNDGDAAAAQQVKAHAQAQVGAMLQTLDAHLAGHGQPWLLGTHYSAVDPLAFIVCRWTRGFDTRPARDYPHVGPYLRRMLERPAVQRTIASEQLPQPWI